MTRQDGRHLALDLLQRLGGVGGRQIEEYAADAVELLTGALERLDRIGKGRFVGVSANGGDLDDVVGQRLVEGWAEMLGLDRLERRRAERAGPGGEKRVGERVVSCHRRNLTVRTDRR